MNLHMAKMYWKKMVDAVEFERAGGTQAGGLTYLLTYLLVTWMKICRLGMGTPHTATRTAAAISVLRLR